RKIPPTGRRTELDQQVTRSLERDHANARTTVAGAAAREAELAELRGRRDVLRREYRTATDDGDRRRAASLLVRTHDVEARIRSGEHELSAARATVRRGEENLRHTGVVHDADQRARQAEQLDRQSDVRPRIASVRDKRRGRRDYDELAQLAGLRPAEYGALPWTQQRRAQLEIDRALERRRDWTRETRVAEREQARVARKQKQPTGQPPARPRPAPVSDRHRQFDVMPDRPDSRRAASRPRREPPRQTTAPRNTPEAAAPDEPAIGRRPRAADRSRRSSRRVS
ncbi:MAG TPA: hypothetical protein VHW26_04615, partial [Solirubrobacteraceae bacterium]|nr:hypothetical protein [Solirubrobacteraceae bacterium]